MQEPPRRLRSLVDRGERLLLRTGVRPNTITLASLAAGAVAAIAFDAGRLTLGGVLVWLSGVLDLYDGRVARATGAAAPDGALLDSCCDRWAELALFAGLALCFRGRAAALAVVLAALAGSLMVSYVRARGEALGLRMAEIGRLQRPERIILLGAGGVLAAPFGPAAMLVALAAIALLGNVTALVRFRHAWRALAPRPGAEKTLPGGREATPAR